MHLQVGDEVSGDSDCLVVRKQGEVSALLLRLVLGQQGLCWGYAVVLF